MFTKDFYSVINSELNSLVEKYEEDELLKKYKAPAQKSSYALLIWFLEFYGKRANYKDYITDGDNDSSCDIVFDNVNNQGEKVFYIVQSKWNNVANSEKETDRDEILKALNEFETLLRGEKRYVNEKLQAKLDELDKHRKNNGEVKFIFLSLSHYKGNADDNIRGFVKQDDKIQCEVVDIDRIKSDYIDRTYKGIEPVNPLEFYQNPEESPITLEIIQTHGKIKIEKPFEAYLFLLRPKTIYNLFDKYKFSLFFKNVRNPLLQSQFNEDIEKTALENPAFFWYYNNGITAITYLLPKIGQKAEQIELTGLQIINGAQTVYAIYQAYKKASPAKRRQMDAESLITLRLLKSGGRDFDLSVTRYTNSQNPVDDRDFCANDDIQIRLQNESFNTNVWYEKRRGEFREVPENVGVIPNSIFAEAYLAYQLQNPVAVLFKLSYEKKTNKDLSFISHKIHKDGLYEKIFNAETKFEDMLCANYLFLSLSLQKGEHPLHYHYVALFKVVFTKYLHAKRSKNINVSKYIIQKFSNENDTVDIIHKAFFFIFNFIEKTILAGNSPQKIRDFLTKSSHYENMKEALEKLEISVNDIESIVLEE
jgi:hypothetical protein